MRFDSKISKVSPTNFVFKMYQMTKLFRAPLCPYLNHDNSGVVELVMFFIVASSKLLADSSSLVIKDIKGSILKNTQSVKIWTAVLIRRQA